jgi:hypothetical protein
MPTLLRLFNHNKSAEFVTMDAEKIHPTLSKTTEDSTPGALHYARRGETLDDASSLNSDIVGYDADRMRARALLTETEEKKLMRRIDWHLMPLCSLMFLLKNIDVNNVGSMPLNDFISTLTLWCRPQMLGL